MTRSDARETVFKLVFQARFQPNNLDDIIETCFDEIGHTVSHSEYIRSTTRGTCAKFDEIDKIINKNAKGWSSDRISNICLAAMRVAVYEALYVDDVPAVIAIDECIKIVKKYEGDEPVDFLNGVLDGAKRQLENESRIKNQAI